MVAKANTRKTPPTTVRLSIKGKTLLDQLVERLGLPASTIIELSIRTQWHEEARRQADSVSGGNIAT